MHKLPSAHQSGISLVETIFTLAIVGILMSVSAPALGNLLHGTRARSARDALMHSLAFARMSAVSTQRMVIACPSRDQRTCTDGVEWQHGWIVFEDRNRNNRRDDDEPLLNVVRAQPGVAIATTTGRKFVRYRPDGSASGTDLTYTICDRRGPTAATAIVVSNPGRIRETRPDPAHIDATCALPME